MSQVIFTLTRHFYDSYIHYLKLIQLSEFPTCYIDEIDWGSDNVYIVSPINGELPSPLPKRNCKIIWWNVEREGCYPPEKFGEFNEVWCSDKGIAERYGAKFVVMGGHKGLGYFEPSKKYDFTTNCYNTPRRQAVFDSLTSAGLSMAPNSFDVPDSNFAASRLQILPRQDDVFPQTITPLRFSIAAAYHLPMIYEFDGDSFPFVNGKHMFQCSYNDILSKAGAALHGIWNIQEVGDNLHELLCVKTNFMQYVEEAL